MLMYVSATEEQVHVTITTPKHVRVSIQNGGDLPRICKLQCASLHETLCGAWLEL